MAADLRLVVHTTERSARKLAAHGACDRLTQRGLADAGRPDEAQDRLAAAVGRAPLLLQPPHREVLDDALLHLVQVVVVRVEDLARLLDVDLAAGGGVPGQRHDELQIRADDRRLRRRRGDALQARDLAVRLALRLGRQACLLDSLAQLAQLRVFRIKLAQLALDRLELLAQEVLALRLAHLLFGLGLDLASELQHLELVRHVAQQLFELRFRRVELEDLLPLFGRQPDVVRDVVREVQRVVDGARGARELGGKVRRQGHQLLKRRDRAPHQRLALDGEDVLRVLGMHLNRAREVWLVRLHAGQPDAPQPEHRELHGPVGQLQQVLDTDHRPDMVYVVEVHLFRGLVELRRHGDVALHTAEVLEQLERLLPPDGERDEDARKHDRRLQRQHWQVGRHRALQVDRRHLAHEEVMLRLHPPHSWGGGA